MIRKIYVLISLFIGFAVISCSKRIYTESTLEHILYPSPPDTARIQFLTSYTNSLDILGSPSKFKTFVAGKEDPLPIKKPYGLEIRKGILYIVDPDVNGLQIINLEEKSFEYFLPAGRGKLKFPINCDVDENNFLYVTDIERQQVVIFNNNLDYVGEIRGDANFKPTDVCVAGDTIFITDPKNNRINAYDKLSKSLLFSFPEAASIGDQDWLYNPLNLYVAGGQVYVTDFGNTRVKIFTMDGSYIKSVGSYGRGLGQFVRPKGIAVDRERNLFVVDAGFENVQIFNEDGQLLMFFGGPYKSLGDMYLPANVIVDYDHLSYYVKYVDPAYELKYLIFVTNQYGPDKVSVYGRVELK